jgi:branched-chain amino acid transport system substrate-binding protein
VRRTLVVATAIAATAGGVAVASMAGGTEDRDRVAQRPPVRPLSEAACSPVTYSGAGRPSALIVLSTTLQGSFADHGIQAAQAVKLVLARRGWRAGTHAVGLQVCDEVPYGADGSDPRKCARTARAVAKNGGVLAVIGPWSSSCGPMLSILNRGSGPVAVVSPSATYLGLTRGGPGVARADPARYAPTGRRNFVRVVPADDVQAAAGVMHARDVGARRLFVLHDGGIYGRGLAGDARVAAERAGIDVVGFASWRADARGYAHQAEQVRQARADAVYLAGYGFSNGPRLIVDLRRRVGTKLLILAPDGFAAPGYLVAHAGAAADGVAFTIATVPATALPTGGRRFADDFERRFGAAPCCFAVHTAQATDVVLDAIAGSDGSRAQVTRNVLRTSVNDGQLGDFRFDAAGDTTRNTMGVFVIEGGRGRFVAALTPPSELLARE